MVLAGHIILIALFLCWSVTMGLATAGPPAYIAFLVFYILALLSTIAWLVVSLIYRKVARFQKPPLNAISGCNIALKIILLVLTCLVLIASIVSVALPGWAVAYGMVFTYFYGSGAVIAQRCCYVLQQIFILWCPFWFILSDEDARSASRTLNFVFVLIISFFQLVVLVGMIVDQVSDYYMYTISPAEFISPALMLLVGLFGLLSLRGRSALLSEYGVLEAQ
jgi:hypothetical protein